MTSISIVGGHGQIARLLVPLLTAADHTPVALVRNRDHAADLPGAEIRLVDLESSGVDDLAAAFAGSTAVVFTAGGGPDGNIERKRTVDLEGSLKSIAAAERTGIARFVQVSAIGVDRDPDPAAGEVWAAYVRAKRDADAALRSSSLDWTIIRPGRLTDDEPTGAVDLGEQVARSDVPRADVAAVLAAVLADDRSIGRQWNLVSGSVPVADAVTVALSEN